MPSESYVQVATDGTGKKVRNTALTESQGVDTSGAAQADLVRYQQVVQIVDTDGDPIDIAGYLRSIDAHAAKTNELLEVILAALTQ